MKTSSRIHLESCKRLKETKSDSKLERSFQSKSESPKSTDGVTTSKASSVSMDSTMCTSLSRFLSQRSTQTIHSSLMETRQRTTSFQLSVANVTVPSSLRMANFGLQVTMYKRRSQLIQ